MNHKIVTLEIEHVLQNTREKTFSISIANNIMIKTSLNFKVVLKTYLKIPFNFQLMTFILRIYPQFIQQRRLITFKHRSATGWKRDSISVSVNHDQQQIFPSTKEYL